MSRSRFIKLKDAAFVLNISRGIAEECYRHGHYEGVAKRVPTSANGAQAIVVYRTRLQLMLDRTWEYVLFHRDLGGGDSRNYGPWVPAEELRPWLLAQLERRRQLQDAEDGAGTFGHGAARRTIGPHASLARDLDIDARRLYCWLKEAIHIPYAMLEDALWHFALMRPEEVVPRDKMVISKVHVHNRKKDQE